MKTKIYLLLCTVLSVTGVFAQNGERVIQPREEARKMPLTEHPFRLQSSPTEMRADYKPFPDSTITYNLKGEPIGKSIYGYNEKGDQTSYKAYIKEEGTNNWIESEKRITTYDSAGRYLTDESSRWDHSKKLWIGSSKDVCIYNFSGQRILYEYYRWDSQTDTWKGENKYSTDYETGNRRETTYKWDIDAGGWIPYERTEYISESVNYLERWLSSEGKWSRLRKIERTKVVDYDRSGVRILIYEEHNAWKDDDGKWNEDYSTVRYVLSSITYWSAWGYVDHSISYDHTGNISSVTLTDIVGNTFITDFTYDYGVNKVNSNKVYDENGLLDNRSCVYDEQGRTIETSWHFNYEDRKEDYKYAYTYIGDSEEYNSTEYYLWDNSKKVFVKESKNMYVRNENGINTMYQTYSWAETKWMLSSYTIYYPNDYTSDLEFEETEHIGPDNKGAFEVGFNLPQDAEVTGSFYITLPQGFVLDEENTILSDELSGKYSITITPQENENTWFVEIKEASERNMSLYSASSYKKILTVAYQVEEDAKRGDYNATIGSLNFALSDGTVLIEQERDVRITVERYGVANEQQVVDKIKIYAAADVLTVDTPDAETVNIYNVSGKMICSAPKAAGKYMCAINGWTSGTYIVTGSKGWTAKIMIK